MIIPTGFAFVEPKSAPTPPILDDLTRKATVLWRSCHPGKGGYRGVHSCTGKNCVAASDNKDHFLPDGRKTHSLLVHYVACHRRSVPEADLAYIDSLADETQPTSSELSGTWEPSSSGRQPLVRTPQPPGRGPLRSPAAAQPPKSPKQLQKEIDQALAKKPRKIIDSFEDQGNDLVYEVSMDANKLPGDPGRFVVSARYLSDGQAVVAEPLRFSSRERASATARSLAQKTVYR